MSKAANTIFAPKGYGFVPGRGTMLMKRRSNAEMVMDILRKEFSRCGWPTNKIKVREFRPESLPPEKQGAFFANIGVRRGLDPELVLQAIKRLPSRCGGRRVCAALDKIPERAEPS